MLTEIYVAMTLLGHDECKCTGTWRGWNDASNTGHNLICKQHIMTICYIAVCQLFIFHIVLAIHIEASHRFREVMCHVCH